MFEFNTDKLNGMKTFIYMRKSPDDEREGKDSSINNQREMIIQFTTKYNMNIIHELSEIDTSGSIQIDKRKAFALYYQKILANEIEKPQCIVVKDISRFGREYGFYQSLKLISDLNIELISTDLSENNPSIRNMKSMFNAEIINTGRYYTTMSYRLKISQGLPLSVPPVGYLKDKQFFVKDEKYREHINEYFKLCISSKFKLKDIVKHFEGKLNSHIVYNMKHNCVYAGFLKFNNNVYIGCHEPYVSKSDFFKLNPNFLTTNKIVSEKDIDFTTRYGK